MADELSPGEIRRNFDRVDANHNSLAARAVDQNAWARENGHIRDAITHVDQDSRERDQALTAEISDLETYVRGEIKALKTAQHGRTEWSRQLKITAIVVAGTLLAALLGAWVTALLTSKGIR